jgi:hypothetical protein
MVMRARQVATVLLAATGMAFIGRAIFDWLLDLEGWALRGPVLALWFLGIALGLSAARELEPWDAYGDRDAILGWGTLVGFCVGAICLVALPMPWGAIAAGAVVVATVAVLRRATRSLPRRPM